MAFHEGFQDFIDYNEPDGERRSYYVKVRELSKNYVRFVTQAGNEVSVPWHRVLKVKRKGVLIDTELSLGGGIDGR